MKVLCILLMVLANISVSGCALRDKTDKEIIALIHKHAKAAENEKVEEYMDTLHEQSPVFASARQTVERMFAVYDLTYKLEDVKVIEKSDQEAKVEYILTTRKITGPQFRNNKIWAVATLMKSDGKWKIYKTVIRNFEFFD